jgi:hypothetical protein
LDGDRVKVLEEYENIEWSTADIVEKVGCSRASCYAWAERFRLGIEHLLKRRFGRLGDSTTSKKPV